MSLSSSHNYRKPDKNHLIFTSDPRKVTEPDPFFQMVKYCPFIPSTESLNIKLGTFLIPGTKLVM